MPLQKINSLNPYYELEGEGTPVVFLFGVTMNHLPWKVFQVPTFTAAGYQCLVFDNRDTGQTINSSESEYSTQQTPKALAQQAAACTNHDTAERLSDIHALTMTAVSEEDLVLPIRHSEFPHQNIPNSELILIPRCGHSGLSEGIAVCVPYSTL